MAKIIVTLAFLVLLMLEIKTVYGQSGLVYYDLPTKTPEADSIPTVVSRYTNST